MRTIWLEEGLRGFYRGLEPSLLTVPVFWAVYFTTYETIHSALKQQDKDNRTRLYHHSVAAAGSALVSDVVTNPLWVVRTRMMTDIYHRNDVGRFHTLGALRQIVQTEGYKGLYKGLSASLLGIAHVVIQFPIYEELKRKLQGDHPGPRLSNIDLVFASAISKLIASTATYPHEVLRSRLQDHRGISTGGLRATIAHIWQREGAMGFYQGLGINLVRVVPACICTFVTYELLKRTLGEWQHQQQSSRHTANT